jgi:hypothetical protein
LLGWGNPVRKVVKKAIIILLLIFIHWQLAFQIDNNVQESFLEYLLAVLQVHTFVELQLQRLFLIQLINWDG